MIFNKLEPSQNGHFWWALGEVRETSQPCEMRNGDI